MSACVACEHALEPLQSTPAAQGDGVSGSGAQAAGAVAAAAPQPASEYANAETGGTATSPSIGQTPAMTPPGPAAPSTPPARLADEYYGPVVAPAGIAPECQGFVLDGLRFSPGGSVLPNRCEPFHATTNNPYAVRCIDAWSFYATEFPGDEYCILPPPPGLGIQIGAHPQGPEWFERIASGDLTGYDSPSDAWVLAPGDEETVDFTTRGNNPEERNYYRAYHRTRSGSHHGVISTHDDPDPVLERFSDASLVPASGNPFQGAVLTGIAGTLRADVNGPSTLEKPVEDAGLYYTLPPQPVVIFNMHHINTTAGQLLKEAWTNLWWEADATRPIIGFYGFEPAQALLEAEAGSTLDLHYFWRMPEPVRIIDLFGHRHVWTPTFAVWVERRASRAVELVYQSFDWADVPTYRYDSMSKNPEPDGALRSDGATSGVLELRAGDELHFNCHITFTDQRAARVGRGPSATEVGILRFANEAFDAEMCILSGNAAGLVIPEFPEIGDDALPDFATLE